MECYILLAETEEENLYICDSKNDDYTSYMDYLKLSNVESDSHRIGEAVPGVRKSWSKYDGKERDARWVFLVIDEFAALRSHWIEEFAEAMTV